MTAKVFIPWQVKDVNKILLPFIVLLVSAFSVAGQPADLTTGNKNRILQTRISCDFQKVTVEQVLITLENKYKIKFTYVNNEIPLSIEITSHFDNQPLVKVLDIIFKDQFITWQQIGSQVLLKKVDGGPSAGNANDQISNQKIPSDSSIDVKEKDNTGKKRKLRLSFSFLKRQKGYSGNSNQVSMPPDSTEIARDSLKKEKERIRSKRKFLSEINTSSGIKNKWSVGLFYSANIAFRYLKGDDLIVSERKAAEASSNGSAWGCKLEYQLSPHIQLGAGVSINTFNEHGNYSLPKQYLPPPHKRNKDYKTDTTIQYKNSCRFLSIPLIAGYTFGDKWFISINSGVSPSLFISKKTDHPSDEDQPLFYPKDYQLNPDLKQGMVPSPPPPGKGKDYISASTNYYYNESTDLNKREYNSLGLMYIASIEAGYRIKNHFKASVSPVYNCFITSIQRKGHNVKEMPYSYGISLAAFYIF